MSKTLYMQIEKNVKVTGEKILLGKIARLSCSDKTVLARNQARTVAVLPKGKYGRYAMSAIDLVKAVEKEEENVEVNHLGEPEFVISYEKPGGKNTAVLLLKTILVSLITFFGTAFSIMTFNTDVDIHTLFGNLYEMFTGQVSGGFSILEITYSIGIGLGVVLFFNHFGRLKITDDPTPLEVQMHLYGVDVDDTMLEKEKRKETEPDG